MKKICITVLAMLCAFCFVSCGDNINSDISQDILDKAVENAIMEQNKDGYLLDEFASEGHIIMGTDQSDSEVKVYALYDYGEYEFQDNDYFVQVSGARSIPVVITFNKSSKDNLTVKDFEEPADGELLESSIDELFPKKYKSRASEPKDSDRESIQKQMKSKAEDYLKKIGRKAKVCDVGDTELAYERLSPGFDDYLNDVWYKKDKYLYFEEYPDWVGNREVIENGTRYIYQTDFNKKIDEVIYTKTNYDTKEVVSEIHINSKTGEKIE